MQRILQRQIERHRLQSLLHERPELKAFIDEVGETYQSFADRAADQVWETLSEAMPGYVAWITPDQHYLSVNERFATDCGCEIAAFVGQPVGFLKAATPFYEFIDSFMRSDADRADKVLEISLPNLPKTLTCLVVAQRCAPGGNAVVMGIDVTGVVEARERLAEQEVRLKTSAHLAALGQLAAGIAHEIKNPLTVLMGSASILRRNVERGTIDQEKLIDAAKRIEAMGIRISNIIRDCRAFSDDGHREVFELCSVEKILSTSAELCTGKFKELGIRLELPVVPEGLLLECRSTQISQVVVNLLANAADAVEGLPDPWVRLETVVLGNQLEILVIDAGPGIPLELREQIFLPFFTTKAPSRGTGLGLDICRAIMAEHHGSIAINADHAHTCFRITLSMRRAAGPT